MAKEYIEREALLEEFSLIVNNCLNEDSTRGDTIAAAFLRMMNSQIMSYPAADVVEVVRCRECKHFNPIGGCNLLLKDVEEFIEFGSGAMIFMFPDSYCSFGERKDGAEL